MDYEFWNAIIIFIIGLLHCLVVNTYRFLRGSEQTYLDGKLFTVSIDQHEQLITGWKVGHFLNYFAIGLLAPNYWYLGILLGILAEIMEMIGSRYFTFISPNMIGDTIINTIGIICGLAVSQITGLKMDIVKTFRI